MAKKTARPAKPKSTNNKPARAKGKAAAAKAKPAAKTAKAGKPARAVAKTGKPAAKPKPRPAAKPKPRPSRPRVAAKVKGISPNRPSWFDEATEVPLIEQYATKLESFTQTMADGRVDDSEIKAQEARVVALMKEIEPELDDTAHEKVTRLLCELTAYDMMHIVHAMQAVRPPTVFQG